MADDLCFFFKVTLFSLYSYLILDCNVILQINAKDWIFLLHIVFLS